MEFTVNRRGLRLELRQFVKDCHPKAGVRHGRIMQFDGQKAVVNWGPGERESHVSLDQIHDNIHRRTGYALLKSWAPGRRS